MSTLDYLTTVKTGFTVKEAIPMLALIADRYHLENNEN